MTGIVFVLSFVIALGIIYKFQRAEKRLTESQHNTAAGKAREKMWNEATSVSDSADRLLASVARPFSVAPLTGQLQRSSLQEIVQRRLMASGKTFNNSTEIFFSVQIFLTLVSMLLLVFAFIANSLEIQISCGLAAFIAIAYPWNTVVMKSRKRARQIAAELPDFVEILQMPILAGSGGIIDALAFTAQRTHGYVSDAVKDMLVSIRTKSLTTQEAFIMTGRSLGTPSAIAFFNALMQSYTEGARVSQTLAAQSRALRALAEEERIKELEKLPTSLVFIFMLHLMPLLLVVVTLPTFITFITGV